MDQKSNNNAHKCDSDHSSHISMLGEISTNNMDGLIIGNLKISCYLLNLTN